MTFVEVAKSLKSVVPTRPEVDYHHSIAVGDTIYVFSQKYNAQPTFNWGQRVIHKGGYEASFDTKTNEWSGPVDFEAITTDENVDEALFALGSRLFLVLFSSFGGLEFLGAHEWVDKKWKKLQFSADAESKQSDDASQYVKFVVVDGEYNGEKLLITYVNSTPRVHGLKVEGDKVTLSTLYTVDDEDALRPLFFPVSGFVSGSKLRFLNAARGCGVRVQLQELVEVDLDAKTAKNVQVEGDHPPFTGLGARSTFLADAAHWVHTTGGTAHGMYDTHFNGQLWQLSTETDSPQWQQLKTTVPDNLEDGDLQVVAVNGTLYVIKPENGVFKGEIH